MEILLCTDNSGFKASYIKIDQIEQVVSHPESGMYHTMINSQVSNFYLADTFLLKRRIEMINELNEKKDKVDPDLLQFLIDPIKSVINGDTFLEDFGEAFFSTKEIQAIKHLSQIYKPSQDKFMSLIEKMKLEEVILAPKVDKSHIGKI